MDWQTIGQNLRWTEYGLALLFLAASILLALFLRLTARLLQRVRPALAGWVIALLRLASWTLVLLALGLAVQLADTTAAVRHLVEAVLLAVFILLAARTTVHLTTAALRRHWSRWFPQLPPTTLADFLVALTVYTIALLMILHQFGLAITPVLTALGVGGLAVALGVQDTLANLFAGLSITLARLIRPGDYLQLENGLEGVVHDIGWRYTTLQTPQHTLVIVPNLRMSQLIVTNLALPEMRTLLAVPVTLPPTDAPAQLVSQIERTLLDAADAIPGLLREPPLRCRIVGITEKGWLQFHLELWLSTPQVQSDARHAVYLQLCQAGLRPAP